MNYIAELNKLYHYCISKKLSKSEIALLHALYMINNAEDWAVWFEADNAIIQRLTGGLSRESINEARNKLKQKGRIDFKDGIRNTQAARYRIISFMTTSKVDKEVDEQVDMKVDKEVDEQVDTISKLNKTKQNKEVSKQAAPGALSTASSKRPKNNYENLINDFTDNEELKAALWAYIQMRVKKRAAPTDHALNLVLKHLAEMSGDIDVQVAILNKSTVSNWTDIFPLKENISQSTGGYIQPYHKETVNERNNRLIAERLAKEGKHDPRGINAIVEFNVDCL